MKTTILLAALCGGGIFFQAPLHAEEGGSGHYLPGAMSSFVDGVTSTVDSASPHNFELHNLDYTREEDVTTYAKKGEYKLFEDGYVDLPTQVEAEDVTVGFERAVTGEHVKFKTTIQHKTWTVEEVAEQMYQRLKSIDDESKDADDPKEFFREVMDEDGDFVTGRVPITKSSQFKTPANLVIVDAKPERTFVRELTNPDNAQKIDAWLKSTPVGFYWVEYAWKKGNTPKRGEFSPDFFIKQGDQIFVVEVKGDEEIADPSADNIKKHEYATDHFKRLNQWLEKAEDSDALSVQHDFAEELQRVLPEAQGRWSAWLPLGLGCCNDEGGEGCKLECRQQRR